MTSRENRNLESRVILAPCQRYGCKLWYHVGKYVMYGELSPPIHIMSYTLHTYNVLIFPIHTSDFKATIPLTRSQNDPGHETDDFDSPEVIIWRPYRWQNDPGPEIEFLQNSVTVSILRSSVESSRGDSQKKSRRNVKVVPECLSRSEMLSRTGKLKSWKKKFMRNTEWH